MSEHSTHFVTWCSIYEDLPDKLSRAEDQEKLVSAAILELPFSLASCLFQNQFIPTRRAQRTPMQKRAFTKPSLYRYAHSPVSVGAPRDSIAAHQPELYWGSYGEHPTQPFQLSALFLLILPLWNVVPAPNLFLFVISLMSQFLMPVMLNHENPLRYFKGPQSDPSTTRQ